MAAALTQNDPVGRRETDEVRHALVRARRGYYEDPAGALAEAIRCHEAGRSLADDGLCARARALQGAVSLHRGDLQGALVLAVDAERYCGDSADPAVRVEVAALKAQLNFFTGSYADALREAELALRFADQGQDADLRTYARRATCLVFGNVGVPDWKDRLDELLALTVELGDGWEEAISRNDIACYHQEVGELEAAECEIERGLEVAHSVSTRNRFALAVLHSTRADIRLLAGRAQEALEDAGRAIGLLIETGEPNPYVLGVTVRAEVQARMALGQLDDARQSGEGALAWLGDRVPQTRSLVLTTLASALREAGKIEEAYDALSRASELERQAFRELAELQRSLERATLETHAARREGDALAAKNRQLAEAHAELERRASQLEELQAQLREQADRDWLTGLHNRRYLARELERLSQERISGPLSLAVLDLDHFKLINDRFGHAAGDHVLVRVARRLCDVLRGFDSVVRSGGEEFLVLMPRTDAHAATACCERIRQALAGEDWERIAPGLTLTTSVGLASTEHPTDLEALVKLADQRLYEAKNAGRDCIVGEPHDLAAVPSR
jgi:diguanylate cyclase (GGDEF)-like protein